VAELLLRGGRPWGQDGLADVLIRNGTIDAVAPELDPAGAEVLDVAGLLLLPGLVDAHCHLDKTLFGAAWEPHSAGDALAERIGNDRRRRGELGLPSVPNMTALLERMVAAGTAHARSHTDVDPEVGLRGVEAVQQVAELFAGRITVQQVAFPQHGVLTNPGTADLVAVAAGAPAEAVVTRPVRELVLHGGRVVARGGRLTDNG
jgi:cytosine deaminase